MHTDILALGVHSAYRYVSILALGVHSAYRYVSIRNRLGLVDM